LIGQRVNETITPSRARISPELASNGFDAHLATLSSFSSEQLVNACVNMHSRYQPRLKAAAPIEPIMLKTGGWRIRKDARCDRTIQDNASTFQQALYANLS